MIMDPDSDAIGRAARLVDDPKGKGSADGADEHQPVQEGEIDLAVLLRGRCVIRSGGR